MVYISRFTHSRRKAEKTGEVEMACIHTFSKTSICEG